VTLHSTLPSPNNLESAVISADEPTLKREQPEAQEGMPREPDDIE
jgi:hypothetical protein